MAEVDPNRTYRCGLSVRGWVWLAIIAVYIVAAALIVDWVLRRLGL